MYIKETNTIVLEIPKSGSRTLYNTALTMYPEVHKGGAGHRTIKQVFEQAPVKPNPTVVGVIRDPIDRLVSAVNYAWRQGAVVDLNLEARIDHLLDPDRPTPVPLKPQVSFLEDGGFEHQRRLFSFENLEAACRFIGYKEEMTHWNKGKYRFPASEIMGWEKFDKIMELYSEDQELYEQL